MHPECPNCTWDRPGVPWCAFHCAHPDCEPCWHDRRYRLLLELDTAPHEEDDQGDDGEWQCPVCGREDGDDTCAVGSPYTTATCPHRTGSY
jgi:hypothetical protein